MSNSTHTSITVEIDGHVAWVCRNGVRVIGPFVTPGAAEKEARHMAAGAES